MLSKNVSDDWYPFKCHRVFSLAKVGGAHLFTVAVEPKYHYIWRTHPTTPNSRTMALRGLHVSSPEDMLLVHVRIHNQVWLVLPNKDIEMTNSSYVVKLVAEGAWDVEQFTSSEKAKQRAIALVKADTNAAAVT